MGNRGERRQEACDMALPRLAVFMSFSPPINISKTQPIYFFTSLYIEVSRYQTLSIFSDVISDQMSLVAVRMTSFSSFFFLPSTF